MAVRSRPRSVAGLSGTEDLVHSEDVRHRKAGSRYHAQLRARRISASANFGRASAGANGAGAAQHRVLSLPRRERQPA